MDEETKKIIESLEKRISKLESLFKTADTPLGKKQSIKEFLLTKDIKDEVEAALFIAYFLEKYEGLTSFNAKDIESGFRKAKIPVPDNVNYKIFKNAEKGFVMDAEEKKDGKKAWTITNTGENYVSGSSTQ